jgi:hypothetical protein
LINVAVESKARQGKEDNEGKKTSVTWLVLDPALLSIPVPAPNTAPDAVPDAAPDAVRDAVPDAVRDAVPGLDSNLVPVFDTVPVPVFDIVPDFDAVPDPVPADDLCGFCTVSSRSWAVKASRYVEGLCVASRAVRKKVLGSLNIAAGSLRRR